MIRADAMPEGMVQLGVLETALVCGRRQREERLLPTGELVDRGSSHGAMLARRVSREHRSGDRTGHVSSPASVITSKGGNAYSTRRSKSNL